MTVKVPESKRYANDNPWLVFEGSDAATVRQNVLDAFGMTADASLSLFDVLLNAQQIATKTGGTARSLGGTVIGNEAAAPSTESASVADEAAPAEEPQGPHPLLAQIEAQTSVADLQDLWARNKAAFDADADLMAAYKARGKGLQAAA